MANILIVDDDANLGLALRMALCQEGHECRLAETGEAAWSDLLRHEPDLALIDLQLPDLSGLELLKRMRQHNVRSPAVILTAFGTVTCAVDAMKQGADDFIEKPLSVHDVCQLVSRLIQNRRLAAEREEIWAHRGGLKSAHELIGECDQLLEIRRQAQRIAALPNRPGMGITTTLILGETGTGKEMVARYIHASSANPQSPFIHVNCTAIPESLFEAEFFGHERGVFTGAASRRNGLLEAANEGTLFLDEIADLPLHMQSKLLVAIESGRFLRVGSTREQCLDARVIAATNCDVEEKARSGTLRFDLYHRLKMFQIILPPLRDRDGDLALLTEYFLERFAQRLNRQTPRLSPAGMEKIRRHSWPGNVRELGHVLLNALALTEADVIEPEHINIDPNSDLSQQDPPGDSGFDFSRGMVPLETVERRLIQAALQHAGGNITEAARLVGMARGTFRYRLEKLRLL